MSAGRAPMTRRRLALAMSTALAAALAPAAAFSTEPIKVGAGEHGDYSRVVLNMRAPEGWSARTVGRVVELRLPGDGLHFDAGDVVERRKAHRVTGFDSRVEDGETRLRLTLNCACAASARSAHGALVIDIRDESRDARREEAAIETADTPERGAAPGPADPASADDRSAQVERARELLLKQLRKAADEGLIRFRGEGARAEAAPAEPGEADGHDMARDMTAGAEDDGDGRAEATVDAPHADPGRANTHDEAAEGGGEEEHHAARQADGRQADDAATHRGAGEEHGMAAQRDQDASDDQDADAADAPDAEAVMAALAELAPVSPCLPDEALDAAAWLDDRPFSQGLAAKRATLYDTLNRVDPDAVAALTRFYLGHQLAEEAATMPRVFKVDTEETRLLVAIADVMKKKAPSLSSPFGRPAPCPGRHGLWQAAALGEIHPEIAFAALAASGRALERMPYALRRIMGGRIGLAALHAGREELAREISRLLMRNQGEPTIDMRLLAAELAIRDGRVLAAQAQLDAVIDLRVAESPSAAIRFGETLEAPRERGRAERHAERLAGYAIQYRDTELGYALTEAEARLRARFGDLDGGLEAIEQELARHENGDARLSQMRRALIGEQIAAVERTQDADAAVSAILATQRLEGDAAADALRARLTRALSGSGASHLAPVIIDPLVAARSPDATRALREASRTAPIGAARDALPVEAERAAQGESATRMAALARYVAGDDELPRDLNASLDGVAEREALALRSMFADSEPLDAAGGAETIARGKQLVETLDAEIELLKELATDG